MHGIHGMDLDKKKRPDLVTEVNFFCFLALVYPMHLWLIEFCLLS